MGLDMYLSCVCSIRSHELGFGPASRSSPVFASVLKAADIDPSLVLQDFSGLRIELPVGYWRKANAIHRWFVCNIQDGEDNCQSSECDMDELAALQDSCQKVLAAPASKFQEIAEEKLPTQGGFFFGPTDLKDPGTRQWYLKDLEETIEIINRAKALAEALDARKQFHWFEYRASW
jgi:hypothetical protein